MPRSSAARIIAIVVSAVAVTAGLLAASPAHAKPVDPTITITVLPAQVRLIPGESVAVRLDTNITTGYSWGARVVGNRAAVAVSQGLYAAPTPADPAVVGASGTTTWIVTATAPGTAVVKFFTTPPGGGTKQRVGSLTVIVRR
jgi:predicted secreted protein